MTHTESLTATCPDHDIEITVRVRTEMLPTDPLDPPAEQEERPAVTPDDALDGWPTCPAYGDEMEVER